MDRNGLPMMEKAAVFDEHRPLLFAIAYRMLGSAMEAEDMLQEAFLRWQGAIEEDIRAPKAYLTAIITRLCIDQLRSARVKRETYIGPWLPEPLPAGPAHSWEGDPDRLSALNESLSMAFLVILETLSPLERAVFLLREVFDYDYGTIAKVIGKSETNCRQIASRARRRVSERRPRFEIQAEESEAVVARFMETVLTGDVDGLMAVLDPDVTWWSDGGGMTGVARKPIQGAEKVMRFVFGLLRLAPDYVTTVPMVLNGGPGMVIYVAGRPYSAVAFQVVGGRIVAARAVVNPEKLVAIPPLSEGPAPS